MEAGSISLKQSAQQKVIPSCCEECQECHSPGVSSYCQQCKKYICTKCVESHQRMTTFSGHKLFPLDKPSAPPPPVGSCKEHHLHGQPTNRYCHDCRSLVCHDCTVKEHIRHRCDFVDKAASLVRNDLAKEVEQLKKTVVDLLHAIGKINDAISEMEAQNKSAMTKIDGLFKELYIILDERKQQLKDKASSMFQKKLQSLSSQLKDVSESITRVQQVAHHTEERIQHAPDRDILHLRQDIRTQIHEVKEEGQTKLLEPSEEMNVDVKLFSTDEFRKCLADADVSLLSVDPSKCTLTESSTRIFELLKHSELKFLTKLSNGQLTKQGRIVCYLESPASGSVTRCSIAETSKHGEYQIHILPTHRGQNKLTIKVDEHEIADSPFKFCAFSPPGNLSKPFRVIKDLNLPHGIAVNSDGEMIVTEWGTGGSGSVARITKDGKVFRVRQPYFSHPTGVDVDINDNVYITDSKTNWIFKFNKKLELLKQVQHTNVSASLYGVTVVGDEVMVCDRKRHTISVYDTNLHFLRTIRAFSSQYGAGIADLSTDNHDNLYISHHGNRQVQVLNSDGDLVRSFDVFEGKTSPSGLCVAGPYVYVASETEHKVCVYTTEGEPVATFGQWGTKPGDFYTPCGVCVHDSYVYVCDRSNSRVQIF